MATLTSWLILIATLNVGQVDLTSLIEQAMDQPVDFEIKDETLPVAFERVADKTGVPLSVEPSVIRLLPYGADTRISAKLNGVRLREGLAQLLQPIGMRIVVNEDRVDVMPLDALVRIGRRATWRELKTLEEFASSSFDQSEVTTDHIKSLIQFQVDQEDSSTLLFEAMNRVGVGTVYDVLTLACESLGWTWYPWGPYVAIVHAVDQTYRELQRKVSIRAEHRPLAEVIAEMAGQTDVRIRVEPGALQQLPAEKRNDFSILVSGGTLEMALDAVAGTTGLDYQIRDDGITLYLASVEGALPPSTPENLVTDHSDSTPESSNTDPIIGYIAVDGPDARFQYHLAVRESDLPDEVAEQWRRKRTQFIDALRKQLETPASEP